MRCLKWWTCAVHLTLLCLLLVPVGATPALTTIQDTLYKADGTRFNGVAYIEWNSFQASDASVIATSSVVVPIVDGLLRVRLVPTSNASAGAHYTVRYSANGKVQFTESWNVIPSAVPVSVAAVRIVAGSVTSGGGTTPPAGLTIPDITDLADALAARPEKGAYFNPGLLLKIASDGKLEGVRGNPADCLHVDGTTGPCGSSGSGGGTGPGFIDQEVPTGSTDGSNTVFTLAQAPSPASSLQLYRNGVLLKPGVDFSLSSTTITFASLSIPQTGDLLLASYRVVGPGGVEQAPATVISDGSISNFQIAANAGIVESKLSLQYPTHSNANDPSSNEKAALRGTSGTPSATNKFVTDTDLRLTNPRAPLSHSLLGPEHGDTTAATVNRGDLIIGSLATGSAKWTRLPLGAANRCLVSNGADAVWNTCLFTGFQAGALPFTGADGSLTQAPMSLTWDASNRRLSVGSNANTSTLSVHDGGAAGSTTLTVRGGLGQGSNSLQSWQNPSGVERASVSADGALAAQSVGSVSTSDRPAWRETGTASDPSVRSDGDSWYNTAAVTRKSADAGQVHTMPQVVCSSNGTSSASMTVASLGTCSIPSGLLKPGDRLAIRATWSHDGTASYVVRWRWGTSTLGQMTVPGPANLLDQKGEAALYDVSAILDGESKGSNSFVGNNFVELSSQAYASGLTIGFEGNSTAPGETLRLIQFTVVRFPVQNNP